MPSAKLLIKSAALALWGAGVVCGLTYALLYEVTPTESDAAAERWPDGTICELSSQRPTLVMFVHPRCPCSRASLQELAVLLTRCRDRVDAQVLFFKPASAATDWARTDLWESAKRIPGVVPRIDPEAVEQRRFGARVSGEVFVYQPDRELVFHGGVTASRGHAGDNAGRLTLESYLLSGKLGSQETPVFGCKLRSADPPNSATADTSETL